MGYIAFVVSEQSRKDLLAVFPPKYEREVCHHVTIAFGDTSQETLDWCRQNLGDGNCMVTSHYDDEKGVECLSVGFECDRGGDARSLIDTRPDGKKYHITHSLSADRKPVHSNDVVGKQEHKVRSISLSVTGEFVAIPH